MKLDSQDLRSWNELGRLRAERNSKQIADFHEGRIDQPSLIADPRTPELAEKVLAEVANLNVEGRIDEIRQNFDPAHEPFIPELEKGGRGLSCCAILGPDEFLVNQGNSFTDLTTWHIQGDKITQTSPLVIFGWSRNRQHFVAVKPDGSISIHPHYGAEASDLIPALPGSAFIPFDLDSGQRRKFSAPSDDASYTHVAISDDGKKILLCDSARGASLFRKGISGWRMLLLYPSTALGLNDQLQGIDESDGDFFIDLSMLHAAMSPDGRYAAIGSQDNGHYLLSLDGDAGPAFYAKLGHQSEYPHDACFSDDGAVVAFNSCHFYSGMTFASNVERVGGLVTPPYEEHAEQKIINHYLRAYASGYMPASMTSADTGAFLLAGAGFAACVSPTGKLLWELGFGSSAGGVDICAKSGRVLIASHSGILHLLDPSQRQNPSIFDGYLVPKEMRRWLFWDRLKRPLIW